MGYKTAGAKKYIEEMPDAGMARERRDARCGNVGIQELWNSLLAWNDERDLET